MKIWRIYGSVVINGSIYERIDTTIKADSAENAIYRVEMRDWNNLEIKHDLVGAAFIVWHGKPRVQLIRSVSEAELLEANGYPQLPGMDAI